MCVYISIARSSCLPPAAAAALPWRFFWWAQQWQQLARPKPHAVSVVPNVDMILAFYSFSSTAAPALLLRLLPSSGCWYCCCCGTPASPTDRSNQDKNDRPSTNHHHHLWEDQAWLFVLLIKFLSFLFILFYIILFHCCWRWCVVVLPRAAKRTGQDRNCFSYYYLWRRRPRIHWSKIFPQHGTRNYAHTCTAKLIERQPETAAAAIAVTRMRTIIETRI